MSKNRNIVFVFLLLGVITGCTSLRNGVKGERTVIDAALPNKAGSLTIMVTNRHEFLAEYSYHVTIRPAARKAFELDLFPQTGGKCDLKIVFFPLIGHTGPYVNIQNSVAGGDQNELIDMATAKHYSDNPNNSEYQREAKLANRAKSIEVGQIDGNLRYHAALIKN